MTRHIPIEPMAKEAFAEFGDVIDCNSGPDKIINQGLCGRHHDRATLEFDGGRAGVSLFDAQPRRLPLTLDMMERHPEGSQCFVPMTQDGFLVIVAPDESGAPGTPRAFRTEPGQAINYFKGTWHGVLTPLSSPGLFAVIDRIGPGPNLEEYWFDDPWIVGP